MMKSICCLSSAALSLALLGACGSTDQIQLDKSQLSTGENNAMRSGGYMWTYTDHNASDSPYHATIDKHTSETDALQSEVDSDAGHGMVFRVEGTIPGALPWTEVANQTALSVDTYWPTTGPSPTGAKYTDAMVPAYPAAGIGFGYQHYNAEFDATNGGKWVGIAFDMKANVDMQVVWVSMPIVGTDLPDTNFGDTFPKECQYYTASNTPATGGSSCFTNYRKGIFSTTSTAGTPKADNTMAAVGTWQRYCVLFSDVAIPNWANAATQDMAPAFDPTRALKVQWDQFQPAEGGDPAQYNLSLDNINMLTEAQAKEAANNCNVDRITADPGTGDAS